MLLLQSARTREFQRMCAADQVEKQQNLQDRQSFVLELLQNVRVLGGEWNLSTATISRVKSHFRIFCLLSPLWSSYCDNTYVWQLSMFVFVDCKFGNLSYNIRDTFIKGDCSERCTCGKKEGFIHQSCEPLCEKSKRICPKGYHTKDIERQVNSTNCSCSERSCVKSKYIMHRYKQFFFLVIWKLCTVKLEILSNALSNKFRIRLINPLSASVALMQKPIN